MNSANDALRVRVSPKMMNKLEFVAKRRISITDSSIDMTLVNHETNIPVQSSSTVSLFFFLRRNRGQRKARHRRASKHALLLNHKRWYTSVRYVIVTPRDNFEAVGDAFT